MSSTLTRVSFGDFLTPNARPHTLGPDEDAHLVGMRLYGAGPFYRELKPAVRIAKKAHFAIASGDIIYNKLFAWKGTFGIVPPQLDGMLVSDKFPTYKLDETRVDPRYLALYFQTPQLWEQARVMSTGSAALSKLTLNPPKFLLLEIPLPPTIDEQIAIVERVDSLASRIHEARALRGKAIEERRALVASALRQYTEQMVVTGTLGALLHGLPRNGWSPKCDNLEGGTAVLSLGAVTGFRYKSTEHKRTSLPTSSDAHYWLQPGDLIMTRSNTPDLVGHAAIYDGSPSPCIYPDLMMKLHLREGADPRFVWYWLQSSVARDFLMNNAKGTSPTMKKISQVTVSSIPFPGNLPLPRQQQIVAELDALQAPIDGLTSLQTATSEELGALLPSILDRMFKGEI